MKLGIVMDDIASINLKKDSTLAMLLGAGRRGWQCEYITLDDLGMRDGVAIARCSTVRIDASRVSELLAAGETGGAGWYTLGERRALPLGDLDAS